MAESDRSTFDPDQIRVFDGSEDDDDGDGSRLPVLIVIALVVLASFAGVVWLAYQKGVASGRSEPRVVVADTDNQNSPAEATGGNPTDYKGLKIYEQPAPNDADQMPAPVTATPTPPASSPTTPKTQPPAEAALPLRAPVTEPAEDHPASANTTSAPPPAPMKVKPEKKVALAAPTPVKPVTPPTAEASAPPRALASDTTASAAHAPSGGGYVLQIGSYKSTEEADAAWASDKVKHAGVLAGYAPDVKKVDLGDKGIWYRLRIASFADKAAANELCEKLKADGGSCFLAR